MTALTGGPAAVDQQRRARDQGGGGRGEEHDGAGDVDGLADAVQGGDPLDDVGAERRVGEGGLGARACG